MCVSCAIVSLDLTRALYRYLKPADDVLPSPTGDLSSSVSPAKIKGHGLLEAKWDFRENFPLYGISSLH